MDINGDFLKSTVRLVAEMVTLFGLSIIGWGALAGILAGPESVGSGMLIGEVLGHTSSDQTHSEVTTD